MVLIEGASYKKYEYYTLVNQGEDLWNLVSETGEVLFSDDLTEEEIIVELESCFREDR